MVVDGSVVMIENVVRRRAELPGRSVDETVHAAAREVARPIVFAVMIITVVYLPLLSLQGVEGKLFRPMALTVIFALIASLVLTLTLMPVLASYLLRGRIVDKDSRVIGWARAVYAPMLIRSTRHPGWTLGLAVLLLLGSGIVASRLGAEFIPRLDEGALTVTTTKLPSIGLSSAVIFPCAT